MALPRRRSAIHIHILLLFLSLITALLYRPSSSPSSFHPGSSHQKILLLTAHPDDECLFFSPTILALRESVYSMCISTGNSEGLGEVRKEELGRSLDVLGVEAERRVVLDHPDLQDNITVSWNAQVLSDVVGPFVVANDIDIILTFDQGGISGHPNHIALPDAMEHMLTQTTSETRLYTLVTVPLPSKYISILAPILARLRLLLLEGPAIFSSFAGSLKTSDLEGKTPTPTPTPIVFIAGIDEYLTALRAMRQHWSQLVWFRWLNVMFSRYMWVNEWVEIV
ncbi:N-acetylglucosaminyl-phosphatidylinositol de-N-acetylase [Marasmius crinis-equi]|uniref:N-acetylglucosaminylphosphatidylinositol deacetylase n=1 Tax=Marasmius crinis-equi TaxID=585013 RepID=A0ABR3FUS0_9AGAR